MGLNPSGRVTTGDPMVQMSRWRRTPGPSALSARSPRPGREVPVACHTVSPLGSGGPEDAWQKLFRKLSVWNTAHTETFA